MNLERVAEQNDLANEIVKINNQMSLVNKHIEDNNFNRFELKLADDEIGEEVDVAPTSVNAQIEILKLIWHDLERQKIRAEQEMIDIIQE